MKKSVYLIYIFFWRCFMAFMDKVKEYFDKSVEVSKEALSKVGDTVQDFGDKSVVMIEIKQLEHKLNKELISLGNQVYNVFMENNSDSLKFDDARVSGIFLELQRLNGEIKARKASLSEKEKTDDSDVQKDEDDCSVEKDEM